MEIDRDKLHNIIKEEIKKYLTEYADPRNRFIKRVDDVVPQLVENWCLVHYCTLCNEDINQCKNHWKIELRTSFISIGNRKLVGNNSVQGRYKALEEGFSYSELLTDYNTSYNYCIEKFDKEKIKWEDNNLYNQCIKDLIENYSIIINLLADFNLHNIIEYINTI